jgi:predicted MFS family arabinose efflux permease
MTPRVHGTISAIWNAAYDLGVGVGAVGIGLVVSGVGFSPAFLLTVAAMLPALLLARRETAAGSCRPVVAGNLTP